ncbi:lipopolysaccharide biosynthesis protein [Halomarina litorea]|uniref:lipopolysaccharide biosynthesis protein n=1 Tax=Halomarina litorea TaxID=2961595 RepID=UPI0020C387E0|nr:lipopolysaccharide biosynthesis protein [Halomarina sp. BCD28]
MIGVVRRLLARLTPDGDVGERTVKSGIWVGAINVSDRVLQLLMVIVLARLLGPAAFGLMGVALLALSALQRFSQIGFEDALVQRIEDDVDHMLDTAWTIQVVRGLAIAAVAILAAPLLGTLFDEPAAVDLVRVVALAPAILAFRNPGMVYLRKDLAFHRQFVYTASGTLTRVTVSIGWALVSPTVWALVAGFIASNAVMLVVSYVIHDYRPRPGFDRGHASDLFGYGKWILGSGVVNFLYSEGDDAFVGVFLGVASLGLYQVAYRVSNAPATEVAQLVSRVMFPAYSKVQDDIERLRRGFLTTVQLTTFVSIPFGVGLIAVTPQFVAVFGEQWEPMVRPLQVLTLYGILRSCRSPTTPLFKSVGRPDLLAKLQTGKLLLLAACIYPAADQAGLTGVALVVVGTEVLALPAAHVLALRLTGARARSIISLLGFPVLGSAMMGATVVSLASALPTTNPLVELAVLVPTGVVVYVAAMLLVDRGSGYGVGGLLRRVVASM